MKFLLRNALFFAATSFCKGWTNPTACLQCRILRPNYISRLHATVPKDTTSTDETSPIESFSLEEVEKSLWYLPPILSVVAYSSYTQTSRAFHQFIDLVSGNQWQSADGGKLISEMAQTALSGPVTFSISILFGTLVGLTVSTLHSRQRDIHKHLIGISEELRELELYVDGFPEPYKAKCQLYLEHFSKYFIDDLQSGDIRMSAALGETKAGSLHRERELSTMTLELNELSQEDYCPQRLVGLAYDSLYRLKGLRVELISSLTSTFSSAHYLNMSILASMLLFIFLLETDNSAMQFLLEFQLSICWGLLVGAYSLLAVVVFDLTTPFTGTLDVLWEFKPT